MRFKKIVFLTVASLCAFLPVQADTGHYYLMSYFKNTFPPLNDATGCFIALSTDGIIWTELNDGNSILPSANLDEGLVRDPMVHYDAPTQTFHYVYTTGWNTSNIGYSSITAADGVDIKDKTKWSPQVTIPVGADIPNCLCCWAPEIFWDDIQNKYMIFWSTDVGSGKRSYYVLTSDFKTFTKAVKFFDPGYTEIDGCLFKVADQNYYLVFKDERTGYKRLYAVNGPTPQGSWSDVPENSISSSTLQGVEGPSMIKIGDEYRVYFDPYNTRQNYRMIKSTDLVTWTDGGTIKRSSDNQNFYFSHCHVEEIPKNIYDWILTGNLAVRQNAKTFKPLYPGANRFNVPGIYNILGKRFSPTYFRAGTGAVQNLPAGFFVTVDKKKGVASTIQKAQ
jgi:hypothetical protein